MFRALILSLLIACGNPIDSCDATAHDCCSADADCLDYFGPSFAYCRTDGPFEPDAGICTECRHDTDCRAGERCVKDRVAGRICLD